MTCGSVREGEVGNAMINALIAAGIVLAIGYGWIIHLQNSWFSSDGSGSSADSSCSSSDSSSGGDCSGGDGGGGGGGD